MSTVLTFLAAWCALSLALTGLIAAASPRRHLTDAELFPELSQEDH